MKLSITIILIFVLSACQSTRNMSSFDYLTSKNWVLASMSGYSDPKELFSENLPTLSFTDSGGLTGSTGCNNFNGNFSLTDNGIKLDPGAMTRKMCPGNGERVFIDAMGQINSFDVNSERLELKKGSETLLSFVPE